MSSTPGAARVALALVPRREDRLAPDPRLRLWELSRRLFRCQLLGAPRECRDHAIRRGHRALPYGGGRLIPEWVRHHDDRQRDQAERIPLGSRECRELFGRDQGGGYSSLLQLDGVVATPRRAGPSVAYRNDGHRAHPADLIQAVAAKWDARGRLRLSHDWHVAKLDADQRLESVVEGRNVRLAVADEHKGPAT